MGNVVKSDDQTLDEMLENLIKEPSRINRRILPLKKVENAINRHEARTRTY